MILDSASEKRVLDLVPTALYINGQWQPAKDNRMLDVLDPATGLVLKSISDASFEDGQAAIEAAHQAQAGWAKTAPRMRGKFFEPPSKK